MSLCLFAKIDFLVFAFYISKLFDFKILANSNRNSLQLSQVLNEFKYYCPDTLPVST